MKSIILMVLWGFTAPLYAVEDNDAGLERTWQAHLGEGEPSVAQLHYQEGVRYYKRGDYQEALTRFRQAAVADPETPHLAAYMIHAEHEAEQAEAARLGAEKEAEYERFVAEGKEDLNQKHFKEAEAAFEKALAIQPANPEAQSLLAQAKDEPLAARTVVDPHQSRSVQKKSISAPDPAAAQRHYQAGLVAYAKHNLQEARKEWLLAARLDSHHPKVFQAIHRVEEELALARNTRK